MKDLNNFFTDLENTNPFVKTAFEGFAGSGKTYTASELAIGIHKMIGSTKPIVFYDTERALKALKPKFEAAGINVKVRESRTLADLSKTIDYCEDGFADILVIDSLTHVWENFIEAFKQQKGRSALYFQDWGVIKPSWKQQFSDKFVQAKVHIIFTGRAGYEYEHIDNEDTGKKELVKSGIKMKTENETAYEPDLLVLMERHEDVVGKNKRIWREATIIKDRTTLIDGKTFKDPSFKVFEEVVKQMLDGKVVEDTAQEESKESFASYESDFKKNMQNKGIILEKVKGEFEKMMLGTGKEEKALKVLILKSAFDTTSWTEVEEKVSLNQCRKAYEFITSFSDKWIKYKKACAEDATKVDYSKGEGFIKEVQENTELTQHLAQVG